MKQIPGTDMYLPDAEAHLLTTRKGGKPFWVGYQSDRLKMAFPHVREWETAVDVGAHVGLMTAKLAERFKRVYAFEPHREAFECLLANTRRFKNVTCYNVALGDAEGEVGLEADVGDNTGNRQVVPGGVGTTVTRLDRLGIHHVGLMKLDVQGYERAVLGGAFRTVCAFSPVLVVEAEPHGKLRRQFFKEGAALKLLSKWGAREVGRIGDDHVLAFSPDGALPYTKYADKGSYHWQNYVSGKTTKRVDQVCEYIRARGHGSILDIGCGDGLFTFKLGAVGIDSNRLAVSLARSHGADAHHLSAYRADRLKREFDAVCFFDSLEHLHLPLLALRVAARIAATLYVLNPDPVKSRWHPQEYTQTEMEALCTEAGWGLEDSVRFERTSRDKKTLMRFVRKELP